MNSFYKENLITERLKQIDNSENLIEKELSCLKDSLNLDIIKILVEIQKQLGYKWTFFSGLMHSSLALFITGITNLNPLKYQFIFERYYNCKYDNYASIIIDLPPNIDLVDYNHIAEIFGYKIHKSKYQSKIPDELEEYYFVNNNDEYPFRQKLNENKLNLSKYQIELYTSLSREAVVVVRDKNVYLINKILSIFSNPEVPLRSLNLTNDYDWLQISKGSILQYFPNITSQQVDYFFDLKVDNFDKLAFFIVMTHIDDETYCDELNIRFKLHYRTLPINADFELLDLSHSKGIFIFHEDIINYLKEMLSVSIEEAAYLRRQLAKYPNETRKKIEEIIENNNKEFSGARLYCLKRIMNDEMFSLSKSYIYKQVYELFLLNHLEYFYPREYKRGTEEGKNV